MLRSGLTEHFPACFSCGKPFVSGEWAEIEAVVLFKEDGDCQIWVKFGDHPECCHGSGFELSADGQWQHKMKTRLGR